MLKSRLKKLIKPPIQLLFRYRARPALAALTSHENSKLKAVGNAIYECLTNTISDEEQTVIDSIEQRRSYLLGSTRQIPVIDFGAGSPNTNRSRKEMESGFHSAESVSRICAASKPAFWAILLFKLIRKIEPSSCVELGSCVGISASYQAAALDINGKGHLMTIEGSPEIAKIAEETFEILRLRNATVVTGPFHETLKGVLESAMPIDFFFNDGHHDHDAVIQYFNEAMPYLSDDAVIVFDDISWSSGMKKAWTEIENDERIGLSIDLRTIGIAFVNNNMPTKEKFRIPLL